MMQIIRNIFLLFLVLCFNAYAVDYTWSVSANKKEAFVNEAIYLKYVCEFNDRAELYTIEFHPEVDNELYTIKPYSQNTKLVNNKRVSTYEYIAFVKKPMMTSFTFEALMKKTNRDSIENTVLGRDNADYEEFLATTVKQDTIKIDIKETGSKLIGQFSMDIKKDVLNVKAYKPFHLSVKISGSGNFDALDDIDFDIEGVKVFSQEPVKDLHLNIDGYEGTWIQKFAFVASKSFTIPKYKIDYFDRKSHVKKTLEIKPMEVKVQEVYKKSELLDEENEHYSLEFMRGYIYYILTFITGFLLAKIKFKSKSINTKNTQLRDKIQNTKSLDTLSMLLILNNQRKFNDILTMIESQELTSLAKAKNQAIKLITDN
ncbi:hypothetical protein N9X61_03770 [Sulfurimonas sp.]|nr:hypothetical protein [Sulfurimonas sp.]